MAWGKKKAESVEEPGTPSVSLAASEVLRVDSKYESDGYYAVKLVWPGSILDSFRVEKVELRPRSKEEFDVYEVGQRVTIGVQPWLQSPTEQTEPADEEQQIA